MQSAKTPDEFQAIYGDHLAAREAGGQHLGRLPVAPGLAERPASVAAKAAADRMLVRVLLVIVISFTAP